MPSPGPRPQWEIDGSRRVAGLIRELYPDYDGLGSQGFVRVEEGDGGPRVETGLLDLNGRWELRCSRRALEILDDRQLRAVVAHELSHVALGHFRQGTVPEMVLYHAQQVRWLMRITPVASRVETTVAAIHARMVGREMEADVGAVALTGDPEALISALEVMRADTRRFVRHAGARSGSQRTPVDRELLRRHPTYPAWERRMLNIRNAGRYLNELVRPDLSHPLHLHPRASRPPMRIPASPGLG